MAMNSEIEVGELRLLGSILGHVCFYIEHNNNTKSDGDDNHSMANDDYNDYESDVDDEKVVRIIKHKQKMSKDHVTYLEALWDEGVGFISGGNVFEDVDAFEANY